MSAGPWGWVVEGARARVLAVLVGFAVALTAWLGVLGDPLVTDVAPAGIVTFELAKSAQGAEAVLASWDGPAREAAMLVQGVDSLYLLVYPAGFSLAALLLGARLGGRWRSTGLALSWIMLAAAPLDANDNLLQVSLLLILIIQII